MTAFTKVSQEVINSILSNFEIEEITLKFDKTTLKKIIYLKNEITLAIPSNDWSSKIIHCGKKSNLLIIDVDFENTESCKKILPHLFQEAIIYVKTRKGYQFYFNYNEILNSGTGGAILGYDILSDKKML